MRVVRVGVGVRVGVRVTVGVRVRVGARVISPPPRLARSKSPVYMARSAAWVRVTVRVRFRVGLKVRIRVRVRLRLRLGLRLGLGLGLGVGVTVTVRVRVRVLLQVGYRDVEVLRHVGVPHEPHVGDEEGAQVALVGGEVPHAGHLVVH